MNLRRNLLRFFAVFVTPALFAAPSQNEVAFDKSIRPLFSEYCLKCHSTEKHKGDMDLERFASLAEVKKHPKVWQMVAEQLGTNEVSSEDHTSELQSRSDLVCRLLVEKKKTKS